MKEREKLKVLLREPEELERQAAVRREEIAKHIYRYGTDRDAGLSMDQCRTRAGLPPLERAA